MKPKRKTALVDLRLVWTCPNPECGHTGTVPPASTSATCPLCGGKWPYDCSQLKSKLKTILEKLS